MQTLQPGTRVGLYEIDAVIGEGGFGVTYRAFNTGTNEVVALKEYFPKSAAIRDTDGGVRIAALEHVDSFRHGLDRFYLEARVLARFDHPHIVRVLGTFPMLGTAYIAMDYLPDYNLEQWARMTNRAPTQDEIEPFTAALLDALDMIHRNDLLHRDLAPKNILLRPDGLPVIIDFGSARQAVGNTHLTAMVTQSYAPWEQYFTASTGQGQGPWTDIYGAAATLYRLLAGHPPSPATDRALDDTQYLPAVQAGRGQYKPSFLEALDWGLGVYPRDRPQCIADWRRSLLLGERPSRPKKGLNTDIGLPHHRQASGKAPLIDRLKSAFAGQKPPASLADSADSLFDDDSVFGRDRRIPVRRSGES